MIQLKRVYEEPSRKDGVRILVDRLWPRGLTKERAAVKLWLKDVAPSTELRKGFGHDPAKWKQFQVRYRKELREKKDALELLKQKSDEHIVTLLYGARDEEHNEALVLKSVLEGHKQ
jgi:uncharacterized protein YeaO (DUF488 family)